MLPLVALWWGAAMVVSPTTAFVMPTASSQTRKLELSSELSMSISQDSTAWSRVNIENDPLQVERGYTKSTRERPPMNEVRRAQTVEYEAVARDEYRPSGVSSRGATIDYEPVAREQHGPARGVAPGATVDYKPVARDQFGAPRERTPSAANWNRVNIDNDPLQVSRGYTNPGTRRDPMSRRPPPRPNSIHYDPREMPRVEPMFGDEPFDPSGFGMMNLDEEEFMRREFEDPLFMEREPLDGFGVAPRRPAPPPARRYSAVDHSKKDDDWKRVDVGNVDPIQAQRRTETNNHPQAGAARRQEQQEQNAGRDMRDDYSDRDRTPSARQSSSRDQEMESDREISFDVEEEKLREHDRRSNAYRQKNPDKVDTKEYDWTIAEILLSTNNERRQARVHDVELNDELSKAALAHAQDMARKDYFSHAGKSNGSTLADRVKGLTKYRYRSVAENLFWQAPDNDPDYAVKGWMESKTGHKDILLSKEHSDIGIGYAYNSETDKHYYVQVFGSPLQTPPAPKGIEPTRELLFDVTNGARLRNNMPPLMLSPELHDAAQRHAEDIARSGNLDDLQDIDRYVVDADMFRRLAANVANREPFNDPHGAMDGWLEKKSGRDYVLGGDMTHIGIGYAQDGENHYYVQLYGSLYYDENDLRGYPGGYMDPRGGPGGFGGPPPPAGGGYGRPQKRQRITGGGYDRSEDFRRVNTETQSAPIRGPRGGTTVKKPAKRVLVQPENHVRVGIPTADF